jgi:hypothetical protein
MRLDAGVRRQSARATIINGPQPALAQASDGPCRAVEALHIRGKRLTPGLGPYAVPLAAPCRRGPVSVISSRQADGCCIPPDVVCQRVVQGAASRRC